MYEDPLHIAPFSKEFEPLPDTSEKKVSKNFVFIAKRKKEIDPEPKDNDSPEMQVEIE